MGGGDKCLLRLGPGADAPRVLDLVRARLAPQVDCMALNANGDPARFAGFDLPVLADGMVDAGPLAGLSVAMDWAAEQGCDAVVTVAGDTPFFPADLVARLRAAGRGHGVVLAATDRVHPVFGLWSLSLRPALAEALARGQRRVAGFAAAQGAAEVRFDATGHDPFFNINTSEDLELARRIAAVAGVIPPDPGLA